VGDAAVAKSSRDREAISSNRMGDAAGPGPAPSAMVAARMRISWRMPYHRSKELTGATKQLISWNNFDAEADKQIRWTSLDRDRLGLDLSDWSRRG
jgi:hypothetical protein